MKAKQTLDIQDPDLSKIAMRFVVYASEVPLLNWRSATARLEFRGARLPPTGCCESTNGLGIFALGAFRVDPDCEIIFSGLDADVAGLVDMGFLNIDFVNE